MDLCLYNMFFETWGLQVAKVMPNRKVELNSKAPFWGSILAFQRIRSHVSYVHIYLAIMAKASVCIHYNYGLSSTSTQDLPKHKR